MREFLDTISKCMAVFFLLFLLHLACNWPVSDVFVEFSYDVEFAYRMPRVQ